MNDIIIKVSKCDRSVLPSKTFIGNDGENLQARLVFKFIDKFVDGVARIEYGIEDTNNYIWIDKENESYILPIQNVITKEGNINFQLVITEEETLDGIPLFKSDVFKLYCKESINAVEEAPQGYELWIDQANQKIMQIDEKIQEVETLNIDVNKLNGVAYITLTDKEGHTKVITVNDGNGIQSITKTGTSGLVDTYTITYTNNTTSTFTVTNGNGIESINKTSTVGLVDTYTITYTNGTSSTFTVTNGKDGEVPTQDLEQALMVYNALPKVSDTGTILTLDNTAKCPLTTELKGNSYQYTTTGKNLYNSSDTTYFSNCTYVSGANTNQYKVKATGTDIIINSQISSGTSYSASAGTLIPCKYGEIIYYDIGNSNFGKNIITQYNSSKVSLGFAALNTGNSSGSYTPTNSNCEYISVRIGYGSATSGTEYTLAPIISKSSNLIYEPYTNGPSPNPDYPQEVEVVSGNNTIIISNEDNSQSQTYPINLDNIELCKIGDYQDYIYKNDDKWYIKKNIGKVVLNGDESWTYYSVAQGNLFRNTTVIINDTTTDNKYVPYCNYYTGLAYYYVADRQNNNIYIASDANNLDILDSRYTNASDFKTWLSTHNTIVYYVLATPTDTEITDTSLIEQLEALRYAHSYDTQTNINQSNEDLPFIITATGIRSLVDIFNGGA